MAPLRKYLRDKTVIKSQASGFHSFNFKQIIYWFPVRAKQKRNIQRTKTKEYNNINKIHFKAFHMELPILKRKSQWLIKVSILKRLIANIFILNNYAFTKIS